MRAEVTLKQPPDRVFALMPLVDEDQWFASVQKAVAAGGPCHVGEAQLMEMAFIDRQKSAALGIAGAPAMGIALGFTVPTATFEKLSVGSSFGVTADAHGLRVQFPETDNEPEVLRFTMKRRY